MRQTELEKKSAREIRCASASLSPSQNKMPREESAPQSRLQTPGMNRLDHLYRMEGAQERQSRAGYFDSPVTVARRGRYSRTRPMTTVSTVSPVVVSITTFW